MVCYSIANCFSYQLPLNFLKVELDPSNLPRFQSIDMSFLNDVLLKGIGWLLKAIEKYENSLMHPFIHHIAVRYQNKKVLVISFIFHSNYYCGWKSVGTQYSVPHATPKKERKEEQA